MKFNNNFIIYLRFLVFWLEWDLNYKMDAPVVMVKLKYKNILSNIKIKNIQKFYLFL